MESYQLYSADTLILFILVYTKPCLHVDAPYLHSSDTRDEEKSIFPHADEMFLPCSRSWSAR